ncbi:LysR family transcriptional regulator [Photobacterium lucens]|uniref:LysR family transcriptional regulator n=1 Tax=Photobacterium lucens TaxID=2562949 RepID=UPI0013717E98|nr:LysR family transcriptional regulator [Photobacterium lucens]MBP2698804.1 LysR family transcriptional regulator [Vibrio parahaemolyticus]MZG57083.1 LysR family transcriptional regulator [Photobacterium lucens]MZG79488.1 LysR family transcriptional regulator [Photobacterium lucens]
MTNNQLFDGITLFVQVVKSGGFGAAAQVMGHSNSYVSKEIVKLENRLGVRLLNRTTRSISLTPEGKSYYQECLQLISDAEQAVAHITQSTVAPKGTLKISCPVWFGKHYLKDVFSAYLTRYPDVVIDLDMSDKAIDVIGDGYDLVIRASAKLDESSLICKRIYSSRICTVASPEYIIKYGRPIHPAELSSHHCFCYSNLKKSNVWDYMDKAGNQTSVDVHQRVRSNNTEMSLVLVRNGDGIIRLPEFYIEQQIKTGELTLLFEDYVFPTVDVYALYPTRKHLASKVRCFLDLIDEMVVNNRYSKVE